MAVVYYYQRSTARSQIKVKRSKIMIKHDPFSSNNFYFLSNSILPSFATLQANCRKSQPRVDCSQFGVQTAYSDIWSRWISEDDVFYLHVSSYVVWFKSFLRTAVDFRYLLDELQKN